MSWVHLNLGSTIVQRDSFVFFISLIPILLVSLMIIILLQFIFSILVVCMPLGLVRSNGILLFIRKLIQDHTLKVLFFLAND